MFGFFDMFGLLSMLRMLLRVFTKNGSGLCCCRVRGSSRSDQAAKADGEGRSHGKRLIPDPPNLGNPYPRSDGCGFFCDRCLGYGKIDLEQMPKE